MHPDCPTLDDRKARNLSHRLQWTAMPGAKGQVIPEKGNIETMSLLQDVVTTHPTV